METAIPKMQSNSVQTKKTKSKLDMLYKQRYLILMSLPIVIWLIVFAYVPLWGWVLAFFNYMPGQSFFSMDFVGLKYFVELFTEERFLNVFRNTFIISSLQLVFASFIFPVAFAVFLNELKGNFFKRSIQTISYLPHFVSWVVVAGMCITMLSPESGIINEVLVKLNLIKEPIHFMAEPKYFYTISTILEVWKETGWNAIIFIAAIAGIDQELYEAATVDGAGRFRKIWNITLPGIKSTLIVILILNIGYLVSAGFEKPFLLGNPFNVDTSEVLDTYALRYGIQMGRFSYGTAIGIVRSVISLALVLITNFISKKITEESLV